MSGTGSGADWDAISARRIVADRKHLDGALMPILHALQEHFGYVDAAAVPVIADELNLSRAEVHGVLSFYHDFRKAAPGRHVVKVCRAESCQAVGGRELEERAKRRLKTEFGQTSADKRFTLDAIYCFGNCACSPAVMIDGKLHGKVTPEKFDALIDAATGKTGAHS